MLWQRIITAFTHSMQRRGKSITVLCAATRWFLARAKSIRGTSLMWPRVWMTGNTICLNGTEDGNRVFPKMFVRLSWNTGANAIVQTSWWAAMSLSFSTVRFLPVNLNGAISSTRGPAIRWFGCSMRPTPLGMSISPAAWMMRTSLCGSGRIACSLQLFLSDPQI